MAEEQQREELSPEQARLIEVTLDTDSLGRNSSDVEHVDDSQFAYSFVRVEVIVCD